MTNEEFWQQAFLIVLRNGGGPDYAADDADTAVKKLQDRWPDPKEPVFK